MSAGKCASTSCAISGLGRDVNSMVCYGVNMGLSSGGGNLCNGLGCKLAVPGCITDTFGGNCIGKVSLTGAVPADQIPAEAAKYLGYPCLDAAPSDSTLNSKGAISTKGSWVAKLWTICDCLSPVLPTGDDNSTAGSIFNIGNFISGLLDKTDANKNDLLAVISKLLPAVEKDAVDFDKLVPQLDLTAIFKLPEVPKVRVKQGLMCDSLLVDFQLTNNIPQDRITGIEGSRHGRSVG